MQNLWYCLGDHVGVSTYKKWNNITSKKIKYLGIQITKRLVKRNDGTGNDNGTV